jgi:ABC-type lipoprotein export system ATPase subunit
VMEMILSLQEEYDTTVLMITHDPRDTKNLDRVIRFVESSGKSPWILEMEAPND